MSASSPVLRSMNFGCAGRTCSHASIASPTIGSTGLVNAVAVLFVGTSSRHTRSLGRLRSCWSASGSRRPAAAGSRRSAARRTATPARPRGRARADTTACRSRARLACNGRSSPVRFRPAHISFAHTSSAITRGSGPISAAIERGSANARRGRTGARSIPTPGGRRRTVAAPRSGAPWCAATAARRTGGACSRCSAPCEYSPTSIRSTRATHAAASSRVHEPGSAWSGCSWSSQRPILISAK